MNYVDFTLPAVGSEGLNLYFFTLELFPPPIYIKYDLCIYSSNCVQQGVYFEYVFGEHM